jgi:CDP-glucose 4,6-dehydratase
MARWGDGAEAVRAPGPHPHEASFLRLDCSKARALLGWTPLVDLPTALDWTAGWYRAFYDGADARTLTVDQIARFATLMDAPSEDGLPVHSSS